MAPVIEGIDPDGRWARSDSAAILIADNGGKTGLPRDTLVNDARIDLGPGGKVAWLDTSHGSDNRGRGLYLARALPAGRQAVVVQHGGGQADIRQP